EARGEERRVPGRGDHGRVDDVRLPRREGRGGRDRERGDRPLEEQAPQGRRHGRPPDERGGGPRRGGSAQGHGARVAPAVSISSSRPTSTVTGSPSVVGS